MSDFPCPRCGGQIPDNLTPGAYPGAISRVDNVTEICSGCGFDEAMRLFLEGFTPGLEDWPVKILHLPKVQFVSHPDTHLLMQLKSPENDKIVSVYTVDQSAMLEPDAPLENVRVSETEIATLISNDVVEVEVQRLEDTGLSSAQATQAVIVDLVNRVAAANAGFLGLERRKSDGGANT